MSSTSAQPFPRTTTCDDLIARNKYLISPPPSLVISIALKTIWRFWWGSGSKTIGCDLSERRRRRSKILVRSCAHLWIIIIETITKTSSNACRRVLFVIITAHCKFLGIGVNVNLTPSRDCTRL